MSMTPRKIFISYRRNDEQDFVERIRDWFIQRYGRDNVFMDFDSIPPFTKFADFIREKVDETDVMVVIIGPRWVELLQERAKNFQDDFVRIEVSMALQKDKLVAPICIKGASVPARGLLPPDLQPLLDHNMAFLNSGSAFLDNIGRIVDAVEREWARRNKNSSPPISMPPAPAKSLTAEEWFNQGYDKQKAGDLDGAIDDFNQAIRLDSEDADFYNDRGLARKEKGDLDEAIADHSKAIRLDPQNAIFYYNRGLARYDKGDLDEAIADYSEAIRLDSEDADVYNNRGLARYDKGDLDEAIADHSEAIRLDPQNAIFYYNRGLARYSKDDLDGAIADHSEAIRLDPDDADFYNDRGLAREEKGDLDGAIADHSEAIRLDPQNADFYNNRGSARYSKDDLDGAIADHSEAIRLDPQNAIFYYNRGIAREEKGNPKGAIADYQKYLDLGGSQRDGDQAEVAGWIRDLKKEL